MTLCYPAAVYFGIEHLEPKYFALILLSLFGLRYLVTVKTATTNVALALFVVVTIFAGWAFVDLDPVFLLQRQSDLQSVYGIEPLFEDGLGLDSIDALEIGLALQQKYGVEIDEESEETRLHFASIANLAKFVAGERANR